MTFSKCDCKKCRVSDGDTKTSDTKTALLVLTLVVTLCALLAGCATTHDPKEGLSLVDITVGQVCSGLILYACAGALYVCVWWVKRWRAARWAARHVGAVVIPPPVRSEVVIPTDEYTALIERAGELSDFVDHYARADPSVRNNGAFAAWAARLSRQ